MLATPNDLNHEMVLRLRCMRVLIRDMQFSSPTSNIYSIPKSSRISVSIGTMLMAS